MPSTKNTRIRIDWAPGTAANDAVDIASGLWPQLSRQAVIDRLVITGLYAMKQPPWQPPQLWGRDRDEWKLPEDLRPKANPGI